MKLIVGIGNPGKEYEHTRHNIGFDTIDTFCNKHNIVNSKTKFNGIYYEFSYKGEKILLLKPQSYVNLSGEIVKKYMDYFKIDIEDLFVIVDDLDQSVGHFKLKTNSSSGGHNGLKNIEQYLGTKNYKRLKIGISNNKNFDTKNYVLSKFSNEDRKLIDNVIMISTDIIIDFITMSFDQLTNKYNNKHR